MNKVKNQGNNNNIDKSQSLNVNEPDWLTELKQIINPEWLDLLINPGGAAILKNLLPKSYPASKVALQGSKERRIWELIGLYYRAKRQWYDAISVYYSMYSHFIVEQNKTKERIHKGMPLVWLAECFINLGFSTLSKRYLMLTLVEDAIESCGNVDPLKTGVYFRLTWWHGFTDREIKEYSLEMYKKYQDKKDEGLFPEWILQEIDQDWIVEVPDANESSYYFLNKEYLLWILEGLGNTQGKSLERAAEYILSCIPGCKTARRVISNSTEYDVVCTINGSNIDFRSELGRYFILECKDWQNPVDITSFAKFCRILDSIKCKFGIIFSRLGITGEGRTTDAEREQLKVFQDRGMVIIVINEIDLRYIAEGGNFIAMLKNKYEEVRLDLDCK